MIVLDTHAVVWWVNGDAAALSTAAQKAISSEVSSGEVLISSITSWEIALLVQRGRLSLGMSVPEWLAVVAQIDRVRFIPVGNAIAVASTDLPGEFHKDPADRLIVTTARHYGAGLVTADAKLQAYPHVKSVW